MASIYTKGSEKTRILEPREGVFRQFDFSDWTEMRIGMYVSNIAATGPNNASIDEVLVPSISSDYIFFGLKNAGQTLPGEVGCDFVGMRSKDNDYVASVANLGQQDSSGRWRATTGKDATITLSSDLTSSLGFGQCTATGATAYCNFVGLKFVISNRGLSTQTITISVAGVASGIAGSDYSATALRTLINNATYTGATVMAWNNGVIAYDIPDCVFFRSPLFLNRIRTSAWRAIRYS